MKPSTLRARDSLRSSASASQVGAVDGGRQRESAGLSAQQRLEPRAALAQRQAAQVLAVLLEQVIGHEGGGRLGEHLGGELLPADAALQLG